MSSLASMIFKKFSLLERTLTVNFRSAGGGAMASWLVRPYPCDIFIHVLFNSPTSFSPPWLIIFLYGAELHLQYGIPSFSSSIGLLMKTKLTPILGFSPSKLPSTWRF